jgi:NAD-dependent SIR2 family protein deacetylase
MGAKGGWLAVVTQNIDGLHERAGTAKMGRAPITD